MDTRTLELVVLGLISGLLCSVAMTLGHAPATGVFAALTAAIAVIALVLRRYQ